jgi:hypothetical protein
MQLTKELIISDTLRKVLEDSNDVISKKLLEITDVTECPVWINYLDIAKDDTTKISYLDKSRFLAYNNKQLDWRELKVGDKITVADGSSYYNGDTYYLQTLWDKQVKIIHVYDELRGEYKYAVHVKDDNGSTWHLRPFDIKECQSSIWNPKIRYMASCGKVITKLLGTQNGKELATFCELFQTYHPDFRFSVDFDIDFVSGGAIKYWYHEDRYYNESGSLGSSCMRYEQCQPWLDFYAKNDDLINLFIIKDKESGKLIGRSLIWNDKYFDRVYANTTTIEKKMISYLSNLGYKDAYAIEDNEEITFNIEYGYGDFDYFPYCDSFRYLSMSKISTSSTISHDIVLDDAEGNTGEDCIYCNISGERIYEGDNAIYIDSLNAYVHEHYSVYSEFYELHILEDEAVWSVCLESYIYKEDATRLYDRDYTLDRRAIELLDGSFADKDDENLVTTYDGNYILSDQGKFSELNSSYIPNHEAFYDELLNDWVLEEQLTKEDVEA